jgi:hypothetical protein
VIVLADRLESDLPQTIVAMVTSNMHRAGYPGRVTVRVPDTVILLFPQRAVFGQEGDRASKQDAENPEFHDQPETQSGLIYGRPADPEIPFLRKLPN